MQCGEKWVEIAESLQTMKELLKIAAWGVVEKLMAVAVALQANRWLLLLIEFIKIYLHIDRATSSGERGTSTAMSDEWLWNKKCSILLKCVDCELQIVGSHCWCYARRLRRGREVLLRSMIDKLRALNAALLLPGTWRCRAPLKWGIGNWTGCLGEILEILDSKWILNVE